MLQQTFELLEILLLICFVICHSCFVFGSSCTMSRIAFLFIIILLDSSHAQEVCSSQDNSCLHQTTSSAQQPSCSSDISNNSSQATGFEADTCPNSFQGTSSSKHSAVQDHEVIDLSEYNTPSMPPDSVELSGLQIYKTDVQTVQPKEMITDTIVLFLFK